ncbi:MAG: hypothetical protein HYY01_11370 [Chloroflexi bacterium]|nr:hypothetical protein [Chloroflexota bacterium]
MLEKELRYYEVHREELLREHEGKFVLIKEESLVGVFTTEKEAYADGIRHFGDQPFLIKRVTKQEEVVYLPALFSGLIDARL